MCSPSKFRILFVMIIGSFEVSASDTYNYCDPKCPDTHFEQSACECPFASDCYIPEGVDWDEFRRTMLNVHNEFRNQFALAATDDEKKVGFTGAANVMVLSYDYALEYTARCHTKKCIFGHHCGITERFGQVGQNLFTCSVKSKNSPWIAKMTFDFWYTKEIALMTADAIKVAASSFEGRAMPAGVGHFTQVAWATTTSVGCWIPHGVVTEFVDKSLKTDTVKMKNMQLLLTCHYGPPGNFERKKMFEGGEAASKCPGGTTKNDKYPGLCGEASLPPPPHPKEKYGYKEPGSASPARALSSVCVFLVVTLNFGLIYLDNF